MFCVSLGVVFVFVGFLVALHGDSSMDYVSIQPKSPFDAHCRHDDVATALIRGICKMQLAVRLDKRPGESHMALDGKKEVNYVWLCSYVLIQRVPTHFSQAKTFVNTLLWTQQAMRRQWFEAFRISTKENPADLNPKALSRERPHEED